MTAVILIISIISFAGCMQVQMLPHLDEALTLQDMSREAEAQRKYVGNADALFDKLLAALRSGAIKEGAAKDDIVKAFGGPILTKDITVDGKPLTECLYRHAITKQAKEKVYLYFDTQGYLTHWEIT